VSIQILRISDRPDGLIARRICDTCKRVLDERPAGPGEHEGTTLMVNNVCVPCCKRAFPKYDPPNCPTIPNPPAKTGPL